jgi:hypothetical protein
LNNEIKKENPKINKSDLSSISESNKLTTVIDLRNDFVDDKIEQKKIEISQNENLHRKNDYVWESDAKTIKRRKNPVKSPKDLGITILPAQSFANIPMGRRPGMLYGTITSTYGGSDVAGVTDSFSSSGGPIGDRAYEGKYGIIKFSDTYKDGPLVFVVGGIAIEDKTWFPGIRNSKHKEGYVWVDGFNNLNNFHVYNCKTSPDAGNGWKECLSLLDSKSIKINGKILVGFSAGADNMYQVLRQEAASNWSVIHIVGAWMQKPGSANKHVDMIKGLSEPGRVFYIQKGGLDVESEGATVENKRKIGAVIPSSNIINSQDHQDGLKKSSQWIKQNIKLNGKSTITVGGKTLVISITSGSPIAKLEAKEKGQGSTSNAVVATSGNFVSGKSSPYIDSAWHVNKWQYKMHPDVWNARHLGKDVALSKIQAKNKSGYENGKLPLSELVSIPGQGTGILQLMHKSAAPSFIAMREAAKKDGITLKYSNAYRTYEEQIRKWFGPGATKYPNPDDRKAKYARPSFCCGKTYRNGTISEVTKTNSNHGFGKAFDISGDPQQKWINMNGDRFGWYWGDAPTEDWHFVFVG